MSEDSVPNSPAAALAAPANGVVAVNTRTLVMVLSLFMGGAAGGGGWSFFSGPNSSKLETSMSDMNTTVNAMNLTLTEIKGKLDASNTRVDDLKKYVEKIEGKLEARILALEQEGN